MNANSNPHEPLVDRALIGLDLTAEHHLANCPCCQADREKTERALQNFAALQREQANRPENFWEEQAVRMRNARRAVERRAGLRNVLIPAAALMLVLALELVPGRQRQAPPTRPQAQAISDQDLLIAVEHALDNGTPYALAPVALVAEQVDTTSGLSDKKVTKESNSDAN